MKVACISSDKNNVLTGTNNPISKKKTNFKGKTQGSSLSALETQGRAIVGLSNINFKGNGFNLSEQEFLDNTDLSEETINRVMELTPEQKEEAYKLYQEGIIPEGNLIDFIQRDEDVKSKMLELIRKGIKVSELIFIGKEMDDKHEWQFDKEKAMSKYADITKMLDKGIDANTINIALSQYIDLSEEKLNRVSYFLDKLKTSPKLLMDNMLFLSCLSEIVDSEDKYKKAVSLFDMGLTDFTVISSSIEDEDKYKKAIELFESGFESYDIASLVKIEDEAILEKTKEAMKKYSISADVAEKVIESEKSEKAAQKLLECGVEPTDELLDLPDDLFDQVISLFKEGHSVDALFPPTLVTIVREYKLRDFIKDNEQKNIRWSDFIQNSKHGVEYQKELSKKDVIFLKNNAFENEFYNPEEYIAKFLELKNLKTPNDESILGSESFMNKIKDEGLGDFAAKQEDMTYENIKALLSIDPKSKKMGYIKKIIEFIQNGKINPSAFRKLSDLNDLASLQTIFVGFNCDIRTKSSVWGISNNLKDDLDLIGNEVFESKKYIDKYIPSYKNEQEGIKNTKIGDAFILDDEKYIRIKTDEDKSEIVKLTKETYARLFPPVERFLTTQQTMGNCYCIETLMSMYSNDSTRINLLKTMEEDDKGNITIKMGNYEPVTFKNGKLPDNESSEIYSSGADGYKLFEYAYSCALVEDKVKEAREHLSGDKLNEFNDFIKTNPNDFFIYKEDGEIKWSTYTKAVKEGYYSKNILSIFGVQPYKTFNNLLLGNGGLQNDVYDKFGYKSKSFIDINGLMFSQYSKKELIDQYKQNGMKIDEISTLEKAGRLLKTPDYLKNHQVQIGLGAHAYSLTQETDEDGNTSYYLYNPHNQGFPIKFDNLNELLSKTTQVTVIEIK